MCPLLRGGFFFWWVFVCVCRFSFIYFFSWNSSFRGRVWRRVMVGLHLNTLKLSYGGLGCMRSAQSEEEGRGGGLAVLWGGKLLALGSKMDCLQYCFQILCFIPPWSRTSFLCLYIFFLLVGQNEKNYVFALSNWLRDMINVLIQDVEFRLGWFFQCS